MDVLKAFSQDAKYALHVLTRSQSRRRYALLASITLGLGVGGTAAAFGVTRSLLLGRLPYANEEEVGVFWKKTDWTEEEFLFFRGRAPGFRDVALYRVRDMILREAEAPARLLTGVTASSEIFDVLGAQPFIGQVFRPGDDLPGVEPVAVLSHGLWQQFGADPSIVGRRMMIDGAQRTVIGVMPRGFWFPDPSVRIWTAEPLSVESRSWNSTLVGRVDATHDVRAMGEAVARLTTMLDERFDYPVQWDKTKGAMITPIRDELMGSMRGPLRAVLGGLALILVIACANVGALMLGQLEKQSRDLAVRAALGATLGRLVQLLVAESVVIAVAAGVVGVVVAWSGFGVITRALPLGAWTNAVGPDWIVFVAAMVLALLAAILIVVLPALSLWRRQPSLRSQMTLRGGKLENHLVVAQVALTVLISTGAALLGRSMMNLYAIHPGVRTDGVAVLDVTLSGGRQRRAAALDAITAALTQLPGVRSAAVAQKLPLRGGGYNLPLAIEGRDDLQGATTEYRMVTPGYLEVLGVRLREGRAITESDRAGAERVTVINEAFARTYFGDLSPIGRLVGGDIGSTARVVGVVTNAAERHLTDDPVPVRYVPMAQMPWIDDAQSFVFSVSPDADPAALLDDARHAVERVAPAVAVAGQTTLSGVHDMAVGPVRNVLSLLSLLTALALTLGAVGIYGVLAHFATRRERDWAIRMALGLTGSRVAAQIVLRGALVVLTGIVIGALASTLLARVMGSLMYGVSAVDPYSLSAAATTALIMGLVAALLPARRAGMTDPAITMRES